jgi:hypothetical protein
MVHSTEQIDGATCDDEIIDIDWGVIQKPVDRRETHTDREKRRRGKCGGKDSAPRISLYVFFLGFIHCGNPFPGGA